MQNLYSSAQSLQMDRTSQTDFSIPGETLMENASRSAWMLIREQIASCSRAVFAAGCGNNGGDALAMARMAFSDGLKNICILKADGPKETPLREMQRLAAQNLGIPVTDSLEGADLIIDGLLGVGLRGQAREPYASLIRKINAYSSETGCRVISLDVPSGLGDSAPSGNTADCIAVRSDMTICMGELKSALYIPGNRELAGSIVKTVPLFPEGAKPEPQAVLLGESDMHIAPLRSGSYKKSRGSIAIIGGSGRFTGAVILAARSAFHSGAGLVTVFTEKQLLPIVCKSVPSAMVTTYEDLSDLSEFDCVLVGPGMGKNHDGALEKALGRARRLVADADGIRAFCRLKARAAGNCILTPHPGEFEALRKTYCPGIAAGTPERFHEALAACAEAAGAVVAYKADTLWIQGKSGSFAVDGSNPSLGVAGSGDVLAGITAALAARSADGDMEKTACSAVLLHQKAGRLAREDLGFYPSSELVKYIGRAI